MTKEVILQIKGAEEEAKSIAAEALKKKDQLLADAKHEAMQYLIKRQKVVDQKRDERFASEREALAKEKDAELKKKQKELEKKQKEYEKKVPKAAAFLLKEFEASF